jgi:hypothetical protein
LAGRAVAVPGSPAVTPAASSAGARSDVAIGPPVDPVDPVNKFVIDDIVRGRALPVILRLRNMSIPRPI